MPEQAPRRRLAAILAADVVGYSRMMGADEAGTLAALKSRRTEILQPLVSRHHGRIIKIMGDGVLVEFASAVNAVECAIELQTGMEGANRSLPEDRRIVLRVGINVGDVMVEGSDLYGDGVNVAARLEAVADAGDVFVSQTVFNHVNGKTKLRFEDLGDRTLKNIGEPVRVYRVLGPIAIGDEGAPSRNAISSKPSIAVLPFNNMSADQEQTYFSDGVTEDILTELSRFNSLFVIARHSSFEYRDRAIDVRRAGRELGVRYLVEGSVRRVNDRVRITTQLIDADTGNHLWSERYDRDSSQVFAIQDEVVQAIVARIAGQLAVVELERSRRKRTENLAAYDCYLRGLELYHGIGLDADEKACLWLEKALELDPDYADALARWSVCASHLAVNTDSDRRFEPSLAMANRAVALDPGNSFCHCALGIVKANSGSMADSQRHFETAMRLNPNDPDQLVWAAMPLTYLGDFDAAAELITTAERLNPLSPDWYRGIKAQAELGSRNYATALALLEHLTGNLYYWDLCYMAACYARLGDIQRAKSAFEKVLEIKPNLTAKDIALTQTFGKPDDLNHLLEPLRSLGLPD
jgi:TolB-like protein/Tfp pilus assembly protein PilF